MSEMQVMGRAGHTTVKWEPKVSKEVETAKATFDAMISKGFAAFSVEDGGKGRRLDEFDYTANEIILIPPIAGG